MPPAFAEVGGGFPMRVSDIMSGPPRTCSMHAALDQAVRVMLDSDADWIPIVSGANGSYAAVMGTLAHRDVAAAALASAKRLHDIPVWQAMATEIPRCGPDDDVQVAALTMAGAASPHIVVIGSNGRLVGVLGLAELAAAAGRAGDAGHPGRITGQDVSDVLAAVYNGQSSSS